MSNTKQVSLKMPEDLLSVVDKRAMAERRTRSNMIITAVGEFLNFVPGRDNPADPPCQFCGTIMLDRDEMPIGDEKVWVCSKCWLIKKGPDLLVDDDEKAAVQASADQVVENLRDGTYTDDLPDAPNMCFRCNHTGPDLQECEINGEDTWVCEECTAELEGREV